MLDRSEGGRGLGVLKNQLNNLSITDCSKAVDVYWCITCCYSVNVFLRHFVGFVRFAVNLVLTLI